MRRSLVPLFNEKVLCGLGRSLATRGRLDEDAVARALEALTRFRALSDQIGAGRLHVVATAAAREASNGAEFIARAEAVCRVPISVLSGESEAELAAAGIMAGFHRPDGLAGDLGGGSLEVIDIRDGERQGGVTLPLGGLRLIDSSGGSLKKAARMVDEALDGVDLLKGGAGRTFYAIGGTWRAVARLHMSRRDYPLNVMHGYRLSAAEAISFAHLLDHLSPSSMAGVRAIAKARRETVPYGALVLERLLRRTKSSEVVVSVYGLREGLIYSMLSQAERAKDPLLSACEELARMRSRSLDHARELCRWTDALFQGPGPHETPAQRRLRHAACLVSDIGWRAHPDYRGEQSLNIIAHADFAGIDHPGRAFLALAIFFRHEGLVKEELSPRISELADETLFKRARIVGTAVRAAHMLAAGMPGVIDKVQPFYEGGRLVLPLMGKYADLYGERLDRRFASLARELGMGYEIRRAGENSGGGAYASSGRDRATA
ncbi:MAG: Ppx/GppA family phosphatase [Hyphomicrobiales bacterium]